MKYAPDDLQSLADEISRLEIPAALSLLAEKFPGKVVFSSSFSNEDQVITHQIAVSELDIRIFTLDTGRLFRQTHSTWSSTLNRYGIQISTFTPDRNLLEPFLNSKGPDSFYTSVDNRKECCFIRKVEPLKRALLGQEVWITGIRAEHSPERTNLTLIEWDEGNGVIKYNPLLHWDTERVRNYIRTNHIPYNVLHDTGFVSIGCEPCTRAVRAGEDFRAGRWWWEDSSKKECGLHVRTGHS